MNVKITAPLLLLSVLALGACSDSSNFDFTQDIEDAANAVPPPDIPFPSTTLFAGSVDGTLNIPLGDGVAEDDFSDPTVALNALDGFALTQPLRAGFDVPEGTMIDPASVVLGESVFVYEVSTTPELAVTGIVSELVAGQVSVGAGIDSVVVVPVTPLQEATSYMVVITDGVTILGDPAGGSPSNSVYRLVSGSLELTGALEQLEPLRQATSAMLAATAGRGFETTEVINIFATRTQSITPPMQAVASAAAAGAAISMVPTGNTTANVNPASPGFADLFIGTLDVPYYLAAPAGPNDPTAISSFWRGQGGGFITALNPAPVVTSIQRIPVLMTVPNAASSQVMPAAGWPVAIFVHGITNDRTFMLAVADIMAGAGFAVIAIDQVMHGITDEANGLSAAMSPFSGVMERHFGLDLVNNESGAPGPDGQVDSSGTHFFSPAQLLNTRDNLRQSAADLLVLSASLGNIAVAPLDASRQSLIGHSLGGTTATTFAAFVNNLSSVTLAMPAAGLVQTVIASPAFSGPILAGLSAAGLEPGTPDFASFVVAAQTVIDAADPINFAARAAAANPIHMIEVIDDQVVPNTVEGAALAGTEPLARVMGLSGVSANTNGSALVRFIEGNHASILSPEASLEAFTEMQVQTATFAATGGTLIAINDPTVVQTAQ